MSDVKAFLLVIVGCTLAVIAFRMTLFFHAFPAIPGILTVTFLRDVVVFSLIGFLGVILWAIGIINMGRKR